MEYRLSAVGIATVVLLVASAAGVLSVGGFQSGAPTSQAQPAACDYESLYDETVESVVLVDRGAGQGTGFVMNRSRSNDTSHVVTNAHVVGAASEVTVRFRNRETRTGTVVGTDTYSDLAVVRVDDAPASATPLAVAENPPDPGEPVAALGNPFGLSGTITQGIVSGVNRSMPTDRGFSIPDTIQTDAAINPGNSGGPLLTCDGTVVGVNTAGIQAARADNIGFAVSSSIVERVFPELVATGEFDWPFLGVQTTPVTPAVAEVNDLNATSGLLVVETTEGGPSEGVLQGATGVEAADGEAIPVGGDVITAIGGQQVTTSEGLGSYLATETSPGEVVTLTVLRDGERLQVNVTLAERPHPPEL